ncbi:MAG: hypothetical protein AAFV53_05315 [Myxococcota bacterium]
MPLSINDGTRPSRLELDARAANERPGDVPDAYRAELEAARAHTPPFDFEILTKRAVRIAEADTRAPAPGVGRRAPRWSWLSLMLIPAVAALALLALTPDLFRPQGTRIRGGAYLETFVLQDGAPLPWTPGLVLSPGDRVQFAVDAQGHGDALVLLNIDGEGTLTVFWPSTGEAPAPLRSATDLVLLEDSIALDDARGPETFIAVVDAQNVSETVALIREVYDEGDLTGLQELDESDPAISVVIISKE